MADISSRKEKSFDREFHSLLKQARETIHSRYGHTGELIDMRVEEKNLNRYLSIYQRTQPHEHYLYWTQLYNKHRRNILRTVLGKEGVSVPHAGDIDDSWLARSELTIQYGQGTALAPRCKDICLLLSSIYRIASDLQATASSTYRGMGLPEEEWPADPNLIRPYILLLHIMRIFYLLVETNDKNELGRIVAFLEEFLGTPTRLVNNSPAAPAGNPNGETLAEGSQFSGLFTMATGIMERMGHKPPPDLKVPSDSDINRMVNGIFSSEAAQKTISSAIPTLDKCTDPTAALSQVIQSVANPETMKLLHESVEQMVQNNPPADAPGKASNL